MSKRSEILVKPGIRLPGSAGVILAGGLSRRMGGGMKALLPIGGKPMLRHVVDRVRPQVGTLLLSVETESDAFEPYGLEQVPDPEPGSKGPLGGLAASLQRAGEGGSEWLLLVPCDAPFLPPDLASRLHRHAVEADLPMAVVRDAAGIQPTFSLWSRELLPELQRAVTVEGLAGFRQFLSGRSFAAVEWPPADSNPFFNVNDRGTLEKACKMAAGMKGQQS